MTVQALRSKVSKLIRHSKRPRRNTWQYTHCDLFHKTATTYTFLTLRF